MAIKNMSVEALKAEIERLQQQNEALKSQSGRPLACKVSQKGALSVYGLNSRFPVTLYAQQWRRLLDFAPQIEQFLTAHDAELAKKS